MKFLARSSGSVGQGLALVAYALSCVGGHHSGLFAQGTVPQDSADVAIARYELKIPMADAGPAGLQTYLLIPTSPGKHPLVLMTHGTEMRTGGNHEMGPGQLQPEAIWFARRGWAVAIVVRRGYGASGGVMDRGSIGCTADGFERVASHNRLDLRTAYDYLSRFREIDASRTIAVGASTGGFAVVSFGAAAPPGLKAVINFSGGWHMLFFSGNCTRSGLAPEFEKLGSEAKIPMLWLYAKNDSLFGPKYVVQVHDAFTEGGGDAELVTLPRSGENGHYLFSEGADLWGPIVEDFLSRQGLPYKALYSDPMETHLKLPAGYSDDAEKAFGKFQKLGPYKAFAVGPNGRWSYSSGKKTPKEAASEAVDRCGTLSCVVIAKDGPP
jgi:dienelactone hydrolase